MKNLPERDLLGYVVGALDAPEQRAIQEAIDADPQLDEELLAIKRALTPLEELDCTGSRPGLARRTCELVANIGQPPLRRFDPTRLDSLSQDPLDPHAAVISVIQEVFGSPAASPEATGNLETSLNAHLNTLGSATSPNLSGANTQSQSPAATDSVAPSGDDKFWMSPVSRRESRWGSGLGSRFTPVDLAVCAAVVLIMGGLLFPAISYTRHQSRLTACQNNLRQIGEKLTEYSELNNGRFVEIPRSGKLAFAGVVGPMLKEKGLLNDDSLFACAGVMAESGQRVKIPKVRSIQNAIGERLAWLQKTMSGNYGYTLGYQTPDGYQAPINLARPNVILMSDSPAVGQTNRVSTNHGGRGQNCLYEDGHVDYVVGENVGYDAIFVNDYNMVAPGCRPEDNVIAPSHLSPLYPMAQ